MNKRKIFSIFSIVCLSSSIVLNNMLCVQAEETSTLSTSEVEESSGRSGPILETSMDDQLETNSTTTSSETDNSPTLSDNNINDIQSQQTEESTDIVGGTLSSSESTVSLNQASIAQIQAIPWTISVVGNVALITNYTGSIAENIEVPTLEDLKAAYPGIYDNCTEAQITIDALQNVATQVTNKLSVSNNGSKVKVSGTSLSNAFLDSQVQIIDLSNLDTSGVTDMSYMFSNCNMLTSLDVSGWDTTSIIDMSYVFYNCVGITNLNLSNWDTTSVTNMRYMFANCSKLTSLDINGWDTTNVTDMRSMFYSCSGLTSLDVSGWDTTNVTDMRSMFSNCSELTNLSLSGWDTTNVTDMGSMFYNCRSLTSLDVSGLDTTNVTDIHSMFFNCSRLTSLDVSNWDTTNVTDMGYVFYNCGGLTSLDVSNWDTTHVIDMRSMFFNCSRLTNLDLSNWNTTNVVDMGYMFYNCRGLTILDLSSWDTTNVTDMSSMFYSSSLAKIPLLVKAIAQKILDYDYSLDNRIPYPLEFQANGGIFEDGETSNKYFTSCAIEPDKATVQAVQEYADNLSPTRAGYILIDWKDSQGTSLSQVTDFNQLLTNTYEAQWTTILNPNPPVGSERPSGTVTSVLGIAYFPSLFSTDMTELADSGQQTINFKETTGFHIGIRDVASQTSWKLTASLHWQTTVLEGSYIQVENSNGVVTSNKNDGSTAPSPSDLIPTNEVSGNQSPQITDTPVEIMEVTNSNSREGVYDYALGDAKLIIPETKYVQPSEYIGTVNWNLINAP